MLQDLRKTVTEVIQALLPLTLAVALLQLTLVHMPAAQFLQFLVGTAMAGAGMVLFFLGVNAGLLPLGRAVGADLPHRKYLPYIFGIPFLIGFVASFAEPGTLILAGQVNSLASATITPTFFIAVIAIGLGFFVGASLLRIILGVPMAYLLLFGIGLILLLSFFMPPALVPVAYDAGGFSTGLLTIPLIMALGLGLSSVLAQRSSLADSFGVIGLASLGPVIGVMVMALVLR